MGKKSYKTCEKTEYRFKCFNCQAANDSSISVHLKFKINKVLQKTLYSHVYLTKFMPNQYKYIIEQSILFGYTSVMRKSEGFCKYGIPKILKL
jgi:hypothetical protein